jgi:hypothetical protein
MQRDNNKEVNRLRRLIPDIRHDRYLAMVVLGLICITYVNMLYSTLAYEFGMGPMTFLAGPDDRFADVIKLSLSFRSVTRGLDHIKNFRSWDPVYQRYYEHPDYGGIESLATGQLTHFHHPPLSTLIFLLCGMFLVRTGSPSLMLILFFCIYLAELGSMIRIGVPREKRTARLLTGICFFCLVSYPALVIFGRGNYVNAGLTTIPIAAFLMATYTRKQPTVAAAIALALAVNIHPNAVIFLLALPVAYGIRGAIKPGVQFITIGSLMFGLSFYAAHALYPEYTIANFLKGVAIYGQVYVAGGAGFRMGSSFYGLIRSLNHGLHLGIPFAAEMKIYYGASIVLLFVATWAVWQACIRNHSRTRYHREVEGPNRHGGIINRSEPWLRAIAAFFLVAFYCILSPVFADYHLLVFVAPLVLAILYQDTATDRKGLLMLVTICSTLMLSPKNYPLQHASVQMVLNPFILCGTVLWLAIALLTRTRQRSASQSVLLAAEGRR